MEVHKMKEKLIFSTRICEQLLDMGFEYKERRRDKKNLKYWIYVFDETPELINALVSLSHQYK